jgi:branched-chain amino acid transport system ATP-binding protein
VTAPKLLLSVKNVETYYGNIRALAGVDVACQRRRDRLALIGANGAGKSTLMMTIFGMSAGAQPAPA